MILIKLYGREGYHIVHTVSSSDEIFHKISMEVCRYYGITYPDLCSPSRKGTLVKARYFAAMFTKRYTRISLERIGQVFSGRNHATYSTGLRRLSGWIQSDLEVRQEFKDLEQLIKIKLQ